MRDIILLTLVLGCMLATFSCNNRQTADGNRAPTDAYKNGQNVHSNDTPTEAYKRLYRAVKSKNIDAIKNELTNQTIAFGKSAAAQYGKPEYSMFENGFTATTFSETLPAIRDERIKDKMGAIEVWNSRESRWEDLPFIFENGAWKLAVGELFAGKFQSPGKGRDLIEKEAANAAGSNTVKTIRVPSIESDPTLVRPNKKANKAR